MTVWERSKRVELRTDEGGLLDMRVWDDGDAWLRIEQATKPNTAVDSVGFRVDRRKELRAFARAILRALRTPGESKTAPRRRALRGARGRR